MTLDELKAFFTEEGAEYAKSTPNSFEGCAGKVRALVAEAERLQAEIERLSDIVDDDAMVECPACDTPLNITSDRAFVSVSDEANGRYVEAVRGHMSVFNEMQERIHALESSGASAFNAWRTSSDVIGAMHVLREVVGAEFVDGQRQKEKRNQP